MDQSPRFKMNAILCISFAMAMMWPVSGRRNHCEVGKFFDRDLGYCVPCSDCEKNQLILRVCYDHFDTKCGKFSDFDFQQTANSKGMGNAIDQAKNRPLETGANDNVEESVKPVQAAADDPWYSVTIVLVGVLVVGIVAVAILATVACVMYRRKRNSDPDVSSTLIQPIGNSDEFEKFKVVCET